MKNEKQQKQRKAEDFYMFHKNLSAFSYKE